MKAPLGWWLLLFTTLTCPSFGQNKYLDSLKRELARPQADTSRVLLLAEMANTYNRYSTDTSLLFARQSLRLTREIKYLRGEAWALTVLSGAYITRGEYPLAMEYALSALELARVVGDKKAEAATLNRIGIVYDAISDNRQGLSYFQQSQKIYESIRDREMVALEISNISRAYLNLSMLDSAQYFNMQAYQMFANLPESYPKSSALTYLPWIFGQIQYRRGNLAEALNFYRQALMKSLITHNLRTRALIFFNMAEVFQKQGSVDSSLYYAHLSLGANRQLNSNRTEEASALLAELYNDRNQLDSAYYFQRMTTQLLAETNSPEKIQQLQRLVLQSRQRQQAQVAAQKDYQNRVQLYSLLAGLLVVILIAFILYWYSRKQQKANLLLSQQKQKVESTLTELRATQAQLIQKEKMASLGELTAGIAHEIQNPLNFVNNYSEVNVELIEELEEEVDRDNKEEIRALLGDLRDNERKIHHHGRRADAIVRGMLEHARTTPGERQPTDLNRLADEYLRLAYQGLRAKDAGFQCELFTDYDPDLGEVEVVAPDIGRVLLNLYNNAFYAVGQKQLVAADQAYSPTVWVSTRKTNSEVEIKVRDNGPGIPAAIREKIFQPFFTTKPTGEGTGLGLSLSYDIITKGHGGTLTVASMENAFTEFVITLPLSHL